MTETKFKNWHLEAYRDGRKDEIPAEALAHVEAYFKQISPEKFKVETVGEFVPSSKDIDVAEEPEE